MFDINQQVKLSALCAFSEYFAVNDNFIVYFQRWEELTAEDAEFSQRTQSSSCMFDINQQVNLSALCAFSEYFAVNNNFIVCFQRWEELTAEDAKFSQRTQSFLHV